MRKILVVDDTADCLSALARLFRYHGHTVECAGNGQQALDVLERFLPDTIILDLMMPVMDGVSFLEVVRRHPQWTDIRVIAFTACDDDLRVRPLDALGVSEILLKGSLDVDRLLKLVA